MLTAKDIAKRLGIDLDEVGYLYAIRFLPEGIKVGDEIRFREHDIEKLVRYLKARSKCRLRGIDPDSPRGPSIPIYSTAGGPRFDPRLEAAAERERERRSKSRTLKAGSEAIAPASSHRAAGSGRQASKGKGLRHHVHGPQSASYRGTTGRNRKRAARPHHRG